ncbi:MAG: hypothetical protein JNM31_04450 [Flavobacteriales bacterium]|nr:hypothetical protein [Flavobacteriales bacterium]
MIGPVGQPEGSLATGARGVGQIHRITFDPQYNGTTNTTVYATSSFGGLWRSDDDGTNWAVVNTDHLPLTCVADVAVDHLNSDHLFISTGHADGGLFPQWESNTALINPIYTIGIYRSLDRGATWHPINDGFLSDFNDGGTTRRILSDPTDGNKVYVATSLGVYKCSNALAPDPTWQNTSSGIAMTSLDIRGLEFKPGDASTLYAGGTDIYMSDDEGVTWQSMTGPGTGLDLDALTGFEVDRINLAVTPAEPAYVYAYLVCADQSNVNYPGNVVCQIYRFDGASWSLLHSQSTPLNFNSNTQEYSPDALNQISPTWMPIAVSPVDAKMVFFGYTKVKGDRDITVGPGFTDESAYGVSAGYNCHADIHALTFQPNVANPRLFAGHDGGISAKTISGSVAQTTDWQFRNNGLAVKTIWRFRTSGIEKDVVIIGSQDTGTDVHRRVGGQRVWTNVGGGDGYGAQVLDQRSRNCAFIVNQGSLKRHDYPANANHEENPYRPVDEVEAPPEVVMLSRTFQVVEHPALNGPWMCFTELYERIKDVPSTGDQPTDIWKLQSDVSKDPSLTPMWKRQLKEVAIAESDPQVIYVTQGGVDNAGLETWNLEPKLMKSITGGNDGDYNVDRFFDITSGLPDMSVGTIAKPIITGIAVDPRNADRVWLSFTGYDPLVKVYRSEDGGSTWSNDDPLGTLADLPVNNIVYQSGTADRLYIATDAGVYFKDNAMSCWARYGDVPNIRVVELRINNCTGKLMAATFGRGVWQADLLPMTETYAHTQQIAVNTTWSGDEFVHGNLRVLGGATLTITGTAYFPKGGRLVVDPGAAVVMDGGTLTNRCEQAWWGVDVWGVAGQSQIPATNQGVLRLMNGGTIEHALVGARAFGTDAQGHFVPGTSGGIITSTTGGTFRNCGRAVWLKPYQNIHNGSEQANRCQFNNTVFTKTATAHEGAMAYSEMARLDGVSGVNFVNCTLSLDETLNAGYAKQRPAGIISLDSRFTAKGSTFHQLTIGIRASDATGLKPCWIRNNTFSNNDRGVVLTGVFNAEITGNTFTIPTGDGSWPLDASILPWPMPYGVYLNGCEGYEVEDNVFTGVNTVGNVGLLVKGSTLTPNEFYRNKFNKLYAGSIMQGNNRVIGSPQGFGLQFRCNQYGNADGSDDCFYDAAVTKSTAAVAANQGSTSIPAGNRFYPECPPGADQSDIYHNNASSSGITYFHHTDQFTTPYCSTLPPHVVLQSTTFSYQAGDGTGSSCPKHTSNEMAPAGVFLTFSGAIGPLTQLKAVYNGEVDGGDTDYLLGLVLDPGISSFTLRNALLAAAPKVTDGILIRCVQRDAAMDPWHLTEALLANSPLSPDVLLAVERSQLDESFIELVQDGQTGNIPWRRWIEAELGSLRLDAERARHDYLRLMLQDTASVPLDSLVYMMEYEDLPAAPVERLALLIARGEWTEAEAWVATPDEHGLADEEADVWSVVLALAQDPENADTLVQQAHQTLLAIAENDSLPGHATARALLARHLGLGFEEPVILPGEERSMVESLASAPKSKKGLIRAQPNPTNGRLNIVTFLPMGEFRGYVGVYNMHGVELQRSPVYSGPFISELDMGAYAPGLYRLVLFGRRGSLDGVSVTVVR